MAKQSLNNIKNWFKTGLKPTQNQFWDTWDSFWHKDEAISIQSIQNLSETLIGKASAQALTNHVNDENAHGIDELNATINQLLQTVSELQSQLESSIELQFTGADVDENGNLDLSQNLDADVRKMPSVFINYVGGSYATQFDKSTKILTGLYGIDPEATIEIFF